MGKIGKPTWTALGCTCLAVGTAGAVIPVIPTVPLYMATAFCLAKGSNRLHTWFTNSGFHRRHLKPFMESKSMPLRSKAVVLTGVTALMVAGFLLMDGLLIPRIIMASVWVFHLWYFIFCIKTAPAHASNADRAIR